LIKQLKREHACALFVENIADPRLLDRIATEAGVAVGGTLYSDALSLPGTAADSYLKLFAHNIEAITRSLNSSR
jgi:zinc/manganese transport system substrate-binding protein